MKARPRDGVESERKWKRMRRENLAHILRTVPKTFSVDLLSLTVCCRYAESLLKNPRVKRYLLKHHPEELSDLETLLTDCERGEAPHDESVSAKLNHDLGPRSEA
jgi:hypothetical protein